MRLGTDERRLVGFADLMLDTARPGMARRDGVERHGAALSRRHGGILRRAGGRGGRAGLRLRRTLGVPFLRVGVISCFDQHRVALLERGHQGVRVGYVVER